MQNTKNKKIAIVGCGLAGSFLAVLLANRGYKVTIYDRFSQEEITKESSKRSYNIILYGYALELLKEAGLWEVVHPYLFELKGSITHIPYASQRIKNITDSKKMPYYIISRARLAGILLEQAARHKLVSIHYQTILQSINRHDKTIIMQNDKTKKQGIISCDVVIGADGTNSLTRTFLQLGQQTNHVQEYAEWVYKQFLLSPKTVEKLHLEEKFEHTWTQKNSFIISHPDKDSSLSALFIFPKKQSKLLTSSKSIKQFFTENFPELLPAIDEITTSLLKNPDGNFSTIHTDPWYYKDFVVLVGDAAHGFYPFFGQGTSAAFGDGMLLVKLIDRYGEDWENVFLQYQLQRKRHMDTLGELSKQVMLKYLRYKKADYTAVYDKVESTLYRAFPNLLYPPLFSSLITDPEHADDHWKNYLNQQKKAKWTGVALSAIILTGMIALFTNKTNKKE